MSMRPVLRGSGWLPALPPRIHVFRLASPGQRCGGGRLDGLRVDAVARDLRAFSLSKFALFDDAQRSAALAFLEAMAGHEDVDEALEYWRSEVRGSRPRP